MDNTVTAARYQHRLFLALPPPFLPKTVMPFACGAAGMTPRQARPLLSRRSRPSPPTGRGDLLPNVLLNALLSGLLDSTPDKLLRLVPLLGPLLPQLRTLLHLFPVGTLRASSFSHPPALMQSLPSSRPQPPHPRPRPAAHARPVATALRVGWRSGMPARSRHRPMAASSTLPTGPFAASVGAAFVDIRTLPVCSVLLYM